MRRRWLLALLSACSSQAPLQLELLVEEGTTWASPPAVSTLSVDVRTASGTQHLVDTPANTGTQTLPRIDPNVTTQLIVRGADTTGKRVAAGTSVPFLGGDVAGYTLRILVQRTGRSVTLPGSLASSPEAPVLAVMSARTLAISATNTSAPSIELYDLATYQPLSTRFTLSRPPSSIAAQGARLLLLDATQAEWLDTSTAAFEQATLPEGALLGDLAGGRSMPIGGGEAIVVGSTRTTGAPTKQLLVVGSDTLRVALLTGARSAAGATWVDGVGLVVCGGSATLSAIEVLAPNSSTATAVPAAPDLADARACATLASGQVVVAGGKLEGGSSAPTWVFDPKCSANCVPSAWPSPPEAITSPEMLAIGTRALLVGRGASGNIVSYELTAGAATPVAVVNARKSASIVMLPTGAIGLVGGSAKLEQFVPHID